MIHPHVFLCLLVRRISKTCLQISTKFGLWVLIGYQVCSTEYVRLQVWQCWPVEQLVHCFG